MPLAVSGSGRVGVEEGPSTSAQAASRVVYIGWVLAAAIANLHIGPTRTLATRSSASLATHSLRLTAAGFCCCCCSVGTVECTAACVPTVHVRAGTCRTASTRSRCWVSNAGRRGEGLGGRGYVWCKRPFSGARCCVSAACAGGGDVDGMAAPSQRCVGHAAMRQACFGQCCVGPGWCRVPAGWLVPGCTSNIALLPVWHTASRAAFPRRCGPSSNCSPPQGK